MSSWRTPEGEIAYSGGGRHEDTANLTDTGQWARCFHSARTSEETRTADNATCCQTERREPDGDSTTLTPFVRLRGVLPGVRAAVDILGSGYLRTEAKHKTTNLNEEVSSFVPMRSVVILPNVYLHEVYLQGETALPQGEA